MKTTILTLVAKMLKMTSEDINAWAATFEERQKTTTNDDLIMTALWLVYLKDKEVTLHPWLDLNRKDELWGIELFNGVCVSLRDRNSTWHENKEFAQQIKRRWKRGSLPLKALLKAHWNSQQKDFFRLTAQILERNGILVNKYGGNIWCREEYTDNMAYCFDLFDGRVKEYPKSLDTGRTVVAF